MVELDGGANLKLIFFLFRDEIICWGVSWYDTRYKGIFEILLYSRLS